MGLVTYMAQIKGKMMKEHIDQPFKIKVKKREKH